MQNYESRVDAMLPPATPDPAGPCELDDYLHAMAILDVVSVWAIPGAPWLDELIEMAVELLTALSARDAINYAWARRDLLGMMSGLDRHPEPVSIPEMYRGANPPAILRVTAEFWGPPSREPDTRARASRRGRNDRCWCMSGKKYKRCHWRDDVSRRPDLDALSA